MLHRPRHRERAAMTTRLDASSSARRTASRFTDSKLSGHPGSPALLADWTAIDFRQVEGIRPSRRFNSKLAARPFKTMFQPRDSRESLAMGRAKTTRRFPTFHQSQDDFSAARLERRWPTCHGRIGSDRSHDITSNPGNTTNQRPPGPDHLSTDKDNPPKSDDWVKTRPGDLVFGFTVVRHQPQSTRLNESRSATS